MDVLPDKEYVVSGLRTNRKHDNLVIIPVMQRGFKTYFSCRLEGQKVSGLQQVTLHESGEPAQPMKMTGATVLAIRMAFSESFGIQNALPDADLAEIPPEEVR